MKTLTIHRALAELKTLDARIQAAIQAVDPVGIRQLDKPVMTAGGAVYADAERFEVLAKANLDSAQQLIRNKTAIKAAIVKSNAETLVTVAGKEMTVAAAITEKSFIALKKSLVSRLEATYRKNDGNYKVSMEKMEKNLQTLLEGSLGKDQIKTSTEDIDAIRKPFLKANEMHIVDPLKIQELILTMNDEISKFEADVDAVLSESNAVTLISIEE
jgi:hypothetical protein